MSDDYFSFSSETFYSPDLESHRPEKKRKRKNEPKNKISKFESIELESCPKEMLSNFLAPTFEASILKTLESIIECCKNNKDNSPLNPNFSATSLDSGNSVYEKISKSVSNVPSCSTSESQTTEGNPSCCKTCYSKEPIIKPVYYIPVSCCSFSKQFLTICDPEIQSECCCSSGGGGGGGCCPKPPNKPYNQTKYFSKEPYCPCRDPGDLKKNTCNCCNCSNCQINDGVDPFNYVCDYSARNAFDYGFGDGEVPSEVRYSVVKISMFKKFKAFEIMKSSPIKPMNMPDSIEGVFVVT